MLAPCSRFIKNANLTSLRGRPMESGVLCGTGAARRPGCKSVQDVWGRRTAGLVPCTRPAPPPRATLIHRRGAVPPARTEPSPTEGAKGLALPLESTLTRPGGAPAMTVTHLKLFPMCPRSPAENLCKSYLYPGFRGGDRLTEPLPGQEAARVSGGARTRRDGPQAGSELF